MPRPARRVKEGGKKTSSLSLLVQAARRQRLTDSVHVAIPRPANQWKWWTQSRTALHGLTGRGRADLASYPELAARYCAMVKGKKVVRYGRRGSAG